MRDRLLGPALRLSLVLTISSLAVQPAVMAATTTPFSVVDDAISDLGVTTCNAAPSVSGTQGVVCSPWWPLLNASLVVGGLAMVVAALLLLRTRLGSRVGSVLLVVAGLSTAAVGVVPLDLDRQLHLIVAAPLFPAQNLAVLLLARPLLQRGPVWSAGFLVAGVVGLLGTLAIVVDLGIPFGIAERMGAYPAVIALAALGVAGWWREPDHAGDP